ncbi:MAG: hypothetical protein KF905_08830 [Flavobacteriales bacterium]|nr:hypothetical protein [Flavobacteriales bacterium]
MFVTAFLWLILAIGSWKQHSGGLFAYDAFGYHLYLPATFIQKDPLLRDLQWAEDAHRTWSAPTSLYQLSYYDDGSRVIRYPMGQAVLWAPWFALGHLQAQWRGVDANGYSMPYQRAVQVGILIYLLLGMLALRRVLLSQLSEATTSITLLLLFAGTNLLDQCLNAISMPHVLLFTLYSGILFFTLRWAKNRRLRNAIPLAVVMGLAVLVRPTEAICVLLPFLWAGEAEVHSPFRRAWRLRGQWSAIGLTMFLIGLPQFVYWYAATGKVLIDPYNNPGEGLDLLSPHTWPFLFGFRKGWFIYTPLMLAAVFGIFLLRSRWKEAFWPVLVFFVVNVYVISSWSNWWYAGSFSSRAMVGSYAVMSLPLAALVYHAFSWRRLKRVALFVFLGLLMFLNLFQHVQYMKGIIDPTRMTESAYWAGFGRLEPVPGLHKLMLVDRSGPEDQLPEDLSGYLRKLPAQRWIASSGTEMDTLVANPFRECKVTAYRLGGPWAFSPAVRFPYRTMTDKDHIWVEATWYVMPLDTGIRGALVFSMDRGGRNYGYLAKPINAEALKAGEWTKIVTHYRTPEIRSDDDIFAAYYWAQDGKRVLVDGPYIELLEPIASEHKR